MKRVVRAEAITVFLTLGLNFALIPRWGLVGAAIAAGATNASLNLLWLRDVKKRLSMFPSGQGYASLLLPTAATIVVLVVVRMFLKSHVPDLLMVAIGLAAAYVAFALSALRFALDEQDKVLATSAYARIRGMFVASTPE